MLGVNKVIVMGHITRDPELKYTPNGQAVSSFGIATNRRWSTPEGEKREEVEFHNIVAWGRTGEVINQYLKKGSPIYVEGRLKTQNWEGTDGIKRSRTEIVVENFQFIGSGNQAGPGGFQTPNQQGGYSNQSGQSTNQANNTFNPDGGSQNNPPTGMSSPAENAGSNPNESSNNNSAMSNPNAADDPFAGGGQDEKKPNIGNPEDISIDDIPF